MGEKSGRTPNYKKHENKRTFFRGLGETYSPKPRGLIQLKALDGESVLQGRDKILDRFADHFDRLLNKLEDLAEEAKEALVQRPLIKCAATT